MAMRGLGDAVALVTGAMGLKPCAGCVDRQDALNRRFPFATTPPPRLTFTRTQNKQRAFTRGNEQIIQRGE